MAESQKYRITIGRKAEKEAGNIPLPQRHKIDDDIKTVFVYRIKIKSKGTYK